MIRRCDFPVRPLASSSSPGFKMLQNISKKVVQIQTKTRRWVVLTNWRQLKMPGERNIYRMKRKGEIFTVDKNKQQALTWNSELYPLPGLGGDPRPGQQEYRDGQPQHCGQLHGELPATSGVYLCEGSVRRSVTILWRFKQMSLLK